MRRKTILWIIQPQKDCRTQKDIDKKMSFRPILSKRELIICNRIAHVSYTETEMKWLIIL